MAARTTSGFLDHNKPKELAKIHIAKQQLGLDDETYRIILNTVCHVKSAKDLTPQGRSTLLDHFKSLGFTPQKYPGRPHNVDKKPLLKKIEALLTTHNLPWSYAEKLAKHMYKKQKLTFCADEELMGITTALAKRKVKAEQHG